MPTITEVTTVEELLAALDAGSGAREIRVAGRLDGVPTLTVPPGRTLSGAGFGAALIFAQGVDGLRLTRDVRVSGLRLETSPRARAVFNDVAEETLGTVVLAGLSTVGRVELLARESTRYGHVTVDGLDIEAADARHCVPRPQGFGVEVVQGAFTLFNLQDGPESLLTCDLTGLSAGRPDAPVRGGGIFVSGTPGGGRVTGTRLRTAAVHSDGGIRPGVAGQISGGVFVVYAAVREVINDGPVTTYGPNDMVLDLWGEVDSWMAGAPITSYGPSAIGFVNFGTLTTLKVAAPIETYGTGARGFNLYDGTLHAAEFDRILTHADAAVGVQISKPFGTLTVHRGIETYGGEGESLVKGVMTTLSATGLSLKPGSHGRAINITGGIRTHGKDVPALEILGSVDDLSITGPIQAGAP